MSVEPEPLAPAGAAVAGIGRRFSVTLAVNLGRALLNFGLGLLLARGLGPDDYGRFAFLWSLFAGFHQFLEVGSSQAFFTFISKRSRGRWFFVRYGVWFSIRLLLPLVVLGLLVPDHLFAVFVDGEVRTVAILAMVASFVQQHLWETAIQVAEAQRETVRIQSVSIIAAATHVALILVLFLLKDLSVVAALGVAGGVYLIATVVGLRRIGLPVEEFLEEHESVRDWLRPFLVYCAPMVPYTLLGGVYSMADRWLLQRFGGSVEQGYFGVSSQIASISLLATVSIFRIFWQEVALAHSRDDLDRIGELYGRSTRVLYAFTVVAAAVLIPWTSDIVRILLGPEYLAGTAALAIMLAYPAHQTLGQLTGTVLMATEKVRVFTVMGIVFMLASMVAAYFMLAGADAPIPGLGLGAVGLALKLVGMQVLQVSVTMYVISRLFGWPFSWAFQLLVPVTAGCAAYLSYAAVAAALGGAPLVVRVVLYMVIVTGVLATLLLRVPAALGLDDAAQRMLADTARAVRGGMRGRGS